MLTQSCESRATPRTPYDGVNIGRANHENNDDLTN